MSEMRTHLTHACCEERVCPDQHFESSTCPQHSPGWLAGITIGGPVSATGWRPSQAWRGVRGVKMQAHSA